MGPLCNNRHMNMLIQKAYRYRLYPKATQQDQLAVNVGHARFVYSFFGHSGTNSTKKFGTVKQKGG